MPFDPSFAARRKDAGAGHEPPQTACAACRRPMPPGAWFCEHCGPPQMPPEDPEERLPPFRTLLYIVCIVSVFAAIAAEKLGIDVSLNTLGLDFFAESARELKSGERAQDADYKLLYVVTVRRANVRAEGSTESKILAELQQGDVVKVIAVKDGWSQVNARGRTGWISSALISAKAG